jgi:Tfp pilus assembly protein PilP/Tfp pilus assembly protein PilO
MTAPLFLGRRQVWSSRGHGAGVLAALRLAVVQQLCLRPPMAWASAMAPLLAACVSAGLLWGWQMSELQEQAHAEQQKRGQLQSQLDGLQLRLAQQGSTTSAATATATTATTPVELGPWHWRRLALAAGLAVELIKPLQAGAMRTAPQQLQLRLRGRYHQHGMFVAALGEPGQAVRLVRYELQSGPAGTHLADLVLELLPSPAGALSHAAGPKRSYLAVDGADPLAEPPPDSAWAALPAHWRAELARNKGLLEALPLSAYALTGTLRQGSEWLALLQDDRMLHTVRVGDPLGPDAGRVLRIAEHGLWLREIVRDSEGRWSEHERLWRVGEKP